MVNKCAAPKCTSGYARNEKKQIAKFHFPLKIAELNKQWIHFVNKRDWLATKHSMLCELHFEEKYLQRAEKCTLQWCDMVKAQVEIQKHELKFKSASSNPRVTSSNPRVTSSNPRVTSSNPRVTSSNPRVTSSNPFCFMANAE